MDSFEPVLTDIDQSRKVGTNVDHPSALWNNFDQLFIHRGKFEPISTDFVQWEPGSVCQHLADPFTPALFFSVCQYLSNPLPAGDIICEQSLIMTQSNITPNNFCLSVPSQAFANPLPLGLETGWTSASESKNNLIKYPSFEDGNLLILFCRFLDIFLKL